MKASLFLITLCAIVTSSIFAAPLPLFPELLTRRGVLPRHVDALVARDLNAALLARLYEEDNAVFARYLVHLDTPTGSETFKTGGGTDNTEVDEDVTGKVTKIIPGPPGRRSFRDEGADFATKRALASRQLKALEAIVKRVADEFRDLD
ncbi:hypothetical protein EIP91_011267 [Steccherinum ochraceum]|uniref:Uncharacterized protein n=1 Tax=Steccherinum ochraceum TaxID=92696 RepID=A0A4R0QZV9_9APHY|nr:hypothetical protein EIP91_011267 [Steccherinum ochraceum]